jgi:uncharacterized damage-inducible protein DinB
LNTREVTNSIRDKILEAIERTIHLVRLAPPERLDWRPVQDANSPAKSTDLGHLLGHLLDCAAGFCAVLQKVTPAEPSGFDELRDLEVNHSCTPDDALARLEQYSDAISRAFEFLADADLSRNIPTVFSPKGEALISLLLGNFEHLISHKYQLFFYLKLLQVPVSSADLYQFRGHPISDA